MYLIKVADLVHISSPIVVSWIRPSFSGGTGRKRKRDMGDFAPVAKIIDITVPIGVDNGERR